MKLLFSWPVRLPLEILALQQPLIKQLVSGFIYVWIKLRCSHWYRTDVEGKADGLIWGNTPALDNLPWDIRKSHWPLRRYSHFTSRGLKRGHSKHDVKNDTHSRPHVSADCQRQNFVKKKKTCSVVPNRYVQSLMLWSFCHFPMNSKFSA